VGITGLFLAVAVAVEFCTARDGRRRLRAAPALLLPFLPLLAFSAYLHARTGDWLRCFHAQPQGWGRHLVLPGAGLRGAWRDAFGGHFSTDTALMTMAGVIAVLIGAVLTYWLICRHRWAEAAFVGLQVAVFATNPSYQSDARYALMWWPLWIALAQWSLRRPAVYHALLVTSAPLMVTFTLMFTTGRWAG
jgi:uncharacterized protein YjeT (DUF2065 family)